MPSEGRGVRKDFLALFFILALGWIITGFQLLIPELSDRGAVAGDILFSRQPLSNIIFKITWRDQSPLYYILLHFWKIFGESPFAVRWINFIFHSLIVLMTYRFSSLVFREQKVAFLAALFPCLSPFSLWAVREGRMYPLFILLSILSAYFLWRYLAEGKSRDLVKFNLAAAANIYNHFLAFWVTFILIFFFAVSTLPKKKIRAFVVSVSLLGLTVLPQILRFLDLMRDLPAPIGLSLSAESPTAFKEVLWFALINPIGFHLDASALTAINILLACLAILFVLGFLASGIRIQVLTFLWVIFSFIFFIYLSRKTDLRDRYLVYMLPFIFLTAAKGALGRIPFFEKLPLYRYRSLLNILRRILLTSWMLGSFWLILAQSNVRPSDWGSLMRALDKSYHLKMSLYMPMGRALPAYYVDQFGLNPKLKEVKSLDPKKRFDFLREASKGHDFVFLDKGLGGNREYRWRAVYLERIGYQKSVMSFAGRSLAEYYSVGNFAEAIRYDHFQPVPSFVRMLPRIGSRLGSEREAARIEHAAPVELAIEAGRRKKTEKNFWRFGKASWDSVHEANLKSGGEQKRMIWAHPRENSALMIAFPKIRLTDELVIFYGITDSGIRFRKGENVHLDLFLGTQDAFHVIAKNVPGWKRIAINAGPYSGQRQDLIAFITSDRERSRHFAFDFDLEEGKADKESQISTVELYGGRTLKDVVFQLKVSRRYENGVNYQAVQWDPDVYPAPQMHETSGPNGEGGIRGRWVLGKEDWDTVGRTRQRSGEELREGIWAHPKDASLLNLEIETALKGRLSGFFGFTDYSVKKSLEKKVQDPVRFQVLVDDRLLYKAEVPRKAGWNRFRIESPRFLEPQKHRLTIQIDSKNYRWAHFVFDLWSEEVS